MPHGAKREEVKKLQLGERSGYTLDGMTQRIRFRSATTVFLFVFTLGAALGCASSSRETDSPRERYAITTGEPRLEFDSTQLMMKNADQVNALIQARMHKAANIQAAQEDDPDADGIAVETEALSALKDAMRIALSRPDQDGSRTAMFSRVRRELADLNAADIVIRDLAQEAMDALGAERPAKVQATYVYLLENLMAEIKPDLGANPGYRKIVERIRDANIEISRSARSQLLLRTMSKPISPSDTAAKLIPRGSEKTKAADTP